MRAIAHSAEAVQSGDAQRGGEISIRAAANGAFAQREIHLLREGFGAAEEGCAHFAFEWGAVEAAGDFKSGSPVKWPQSVQAAFQAAHVGNAKRTQIENS